LFHYLFGGTRFAVEAGEEVNRLADAQFFRQARFLQRDAQPFAHLALILIPGMSKDRYLPRGGLQQAFENLNRSRLAGAVRTKQAKALAYLDFKVQPTHGLDFSIVGLTQVAALDRNGHRIESLRGGVAHESVTEIVIIQAAGGLFVLGIEHSGHGCDVRVDVTDSG